jgi:hypothetical protein
MIVADLGEGNMIRGIAYKAQSGEDIGGIGVAILGADNSLDLSPNAYDEGWACWTSADRCSSVCGVYYGN